MHLLLAGLALAQSAPASPEADGEDLDFDLPSEPAVQGDQLYELFMTHVQTGAAPLLISSLGLEPLESERMLGAPDVGMCLSTKGDRIDGIFLANGWYPYMDCPKGSFVGALPFGLVWGMSSRDVNRRLGAPMVGEDRMAYWADGKGAYIQVTIGPHDEGLSALEIVSGEYTAYSSWFREHPRSKQGRLSYVPGASEPVGDDYEEPAVPAPREPEARPAPKRTVAAKVPKAEKKAKEPAFPSIDSPARTGAKAPNEAAVVIGLEDYPFLSAGVPFAKRDADAFNDMLVYTRGVPMGRIQSLSSGAREQILAAIERSAKEAGSGGTVWVYFAGHGAANPRSGERMLLGDDVRADVTAFATRGVGVGEIEKIVTAQGARPVMVLDTCFAGASRSGASILGGTRLVVPGYALAGPSSEGSAQWNAAGPDQISGPLPGVDHGAFTYFAVGALRGWADGELDGQPDRTVTAGEAQAYVSRMLRRSGKNEQSPVYVGPDDLVLATGVTEKGPER